MYGKKHFTVSFVFLVTIAIALQSVRGQDCDPTSGCSEQAYCVASGFCSCLSGFSGDSCAVQPQSSCISSYKDPNESEFSFDSQLESSLTLNMLNIQITTSLEKNRYKDSSASPLEEDNHDSIYSLGTTILWSGSSACDYPSSSFWTKAAVSDDLCLDSYAFRMDIEDSISVCGFIFDPVTNAWTNNVTISRYYSQPPDMSIVDPSRRAEGRRMITVESETSIISIPSDEEPISKPPSASTDVASSSTTSEDEEEAITSTVSTTEPSYDRALYLKVAAGIAGAVGIAFIAAIIVVIAIRKRRSRNAQAQFNFEGIDSN